MIVKMIGIALCLSAFFSVGMSQEKKDTTDLFKMMDESDKKVAASATDYTTATFKGTKIIQGPSVETIGAGNLNFSILHRFAPLSGGGSEDFGLDGPATIRFGLDYGVTDRFNIGIGRSNLNKEFDGFLKYKLLRQSTGKIKMPITVTAIGNAYYISNDEYIKARDIKGTDNLNYGAALCIARKFNDYVSLQVTPTYIHYNVIPDPTLSPTNDFFSLGVGGRLRISKRVNFTAEYYAQFNKMEGTQDAFSVGFDIETGGHVFQLHFTNAIGMTERAFITQTTGKWGEDVRFGFNISRIFVINKPKKAIKP